MSLVGLKQAEVTNFRGPMISPQVEASDIPQDASLLAENVTYGPGYVKTREGHEQLFAASGPISSLYNWTAAGINRCVYVRINGSVVVRNLDTGVEEVLGTVDSGYQHLQEAGNRIYMSTAKPDGTGSDVWIWTGTFTNDAPDFIRAMPGPLTVAPTVTENLTATSHVTAGTHRFSYILESKSGFIGKPGPIVSVIASGTKQLVFSITFSTVPAWAAKVHILMTDKDNPEDFRFVPGGTFGVVGGSTNAFISAVIDVSDTELVKGDSAVNNKLLITQNPDGTTPIGAFKVIAYGNRLVYVTRSKAYISGVDSFEEISEDLNAIELPGQKELTTAASIAHGLYLIGRNYTFSLADPQTGDDPVAWPRPVQISGGIGTPSIYGASANNDQGYMWVAAEGGLYLMDGGAYASIPASYYQTPLWERINWRVPHKVIVFDHAQSQRVFVAAPLDDETEAYHLFVFDYSAGKDAEDIKFSHDWVNGYPISAISAVKDPTSKRTEIVIASSATGTVLRRRGRAEAIEMQGSGHTDAGAYIESTFETAPLPSSSLFNRHQVRAFGVRCYGDGVLRMTANSMDATKQQTLLPIQLALKPDKSYRRRLYQLSTRTSLRISVDRNPGAWWLLSGVCAFYRWNRIK